MENPPISLTIRETKAIIGFPLALEEYADDSLLNSLLVYVTEKNYIEIQTIPSSSYKKLTDDTFKSFVSGYLAELMTSEKISTITLAKDRPYQNGRACARYELLKSILPSESQSYIRGVPEELTGIPKRKTGRLESMVNSKYAKGSSQEVMALLKDVARACAKFERTKVAEKFEFQNFLANWQQLSLKHKRREEVEKKGKKGKKETSTIYHSATHPSQLSTICEFERPFIVEAFEAPWREMEELKKRFEEHIKSYALNVSFKDYESKIQFLENQMWSSKAFVLKHTLKRQITQKRSDGSLDLAKTITETRRTLNSVINEDKFREYVLEQGLDISFYIANFKLSDNSIVKVIELESIKKSKIPQIIEELKRKNDERATSRRELAEKRHRYDAICNKIGTMSNTRRMGYPSDLDINASLEFLDPDFQEELKKESKKEDDSRSITYNDLLNEMHEYVNAVDLFDEYIGIA